MKKQILFSTIFAIAALLGSTQGAFATSQVISGTLAASKTITVGTGTVSTSIDPGDGHLGTTLTPSFVVSTNENTGGITYEGRVISSTDIVSGLYIDGGGTVDCYIALCNSITSRLPTSQSITYALTGGGASPNAIAYKMTLPTTLRTSGDGTIADFTWSGADTGSWKSTGTTGGGVFKVSTNIGTDVQNSSYEPSIDLAGEYQATLRMTFDS